MRYSWQHTLQQLPRHPIISLALAGLFLAAPVANAAGLDLKWQEPEKFQDIEASNLASQKQFQQRVLDELGNDIQNAANKYLPADYHLEMTVTDMDLAGDVEYFFTRFPTGIRVMRDLYFPSIAFNYALTDGEGTVLKTGNENIKDMGYQYSGVRMVKQAPLGYEKRMIDDWFRDTFGDS